MLCINNVSRDIIETFYEKRGKYTVAYNQITTTGAIAPGPGPKGPSPKVIRDAIYNSLNSNGFCFKWTNKTHQPYSGILDTGSGTTIDLYIYAWRIINGGRKNLQSEKRIEISSTANSVGFTRPITTTQKTLLLGLYDSPSGSPIFAAWDAPANANRGKQKSCQVSVENLREALTNQIYQCNDSHGNTIYTFQPDWLGDYIDLVSPGNTLAIPTSITTGSLATKIKTATMPHRKSRTIKSTEDILAQIGNLTETEREVVTKQRIGQGLFKDLLKNKYNCQCALCNIKTESLLVGSHIKGWRDSTDAEKLDENNGLLLCSHHDALFDKHLISFDVNGDLMISPTLSASEQVELQIASIPSISLSASMETFMKDHRAKLKK